MMSSPCGDSEKSEVYCWPCFGIIANIANDPSNVSRDGQYNDYWMRKFSNFKPLGIGTFLNKNQFTKYIVVTFKNDWSGFKNGMAFEKSFEDRGRGKMGSIQRRTSPGSRPYGWVAREDDYKSDGPLGEYLRSNGALKTVLELIQEANTSRGKTLWDLMNEIESRNEYLNQLRDDYIHKRMSTVEMLQEQDKMYRCFEEATVKLQRFTREHISWVVEEQEMLKFMLQRKGKLLDSWRKDLNKREKALNEREGRILEVENLMREKEAVEKVLELERELNEKRRLKVLELERELEEKRRLKVLDLERELEEKGRLETEIQELKDQVKDLKNLSQDLLVKERLCNDELQGIRNELINREKEAVEKVLELERELDGKWRLKVLELEQELEEKRRLETEIQELKDQMKDLKTLSQDLLVKERLCNDELQGVRKELINVQLRKRKEALAERARRILEVEDIKREKEAVEKDLELEREVNEKRGLEVLELARELEEKRGLKVLELERELEEKRRLETEIQELKDQMKDLKTVYQDLLVKERLCNDELQGVRKELINREKGAVDKVLELERKLDEKHKLEIDELKDQMNDLIVKERQSNDELQEGRGELMKGLSGRTVGRRAIIGIKRMGEIDPKAFMKTCNERFPHEDFQIKALELCSLWQEKLNNPQWHPFRVVENDSGIHQSVLVEDDELLRGLKDEWGEEIYDAVVTALKDVHVYNPSGCYSVQEFWNFKENRKATFKEVIGHVFEQLKTLKRKRRRV